MTKREFYIKVKKMEKMQKDKKRTRVGSVKCRVKDRNNMPAQIT